MKTFLIKKACTGSKVISVEDLKMARGLDGSGPTFSVQKVSPHHLFLGAVQNLWGTRAGFKARGARSLFGLQKKGAKTFFDD